MELHLTSTECHLPYGIAEYYLPPDTGEHTRLNPNQTGWYSICLLQRDGRLSWPRWPRIPRLINYVDYNNNNINNNDDIYSAVIIAEPLREFTRFTRWIQKRRQVAADLWTKPTGLSRRPAYAASELHPPSPLIEADMLTTTLRRHPWWNTVDIMMKWCAVLHEVFLSVCVLNSAVIYCALSRSLDLLRFIRRMWSWRSWRGFRNICWNGSTLSCMRDYRVLTLHHRSTECKLCSSVGLFKCNVKKFGNAPKLKIFN